VRARREREPSPPVIRSDLLALSHSKETHKAVGELGPFVRASAF
jgi:hypothetical protein